MIEDELDLHNTTVDYALEDYDVTLMRELIAPVFDELRDEMMIQEFSVELPPQSVADSRPWMLVASDDQTFLGMQTGTTELTDGDLLIGKLGEFSVTTTYFIVHVWVHHD